MISLSNLKVLVVDDIPAVRNILIQMLVNLKLGGQFDEAGDGEEAWVLLQQQAYDLVICDVSMPRVDGLELRRRLRASPRHKNLPFLLITGEVSDEQENACKANSLDGYLHKPFRSAKLKERLLKILGKGRGEKEE